MVSSSKPVRIPIRQIGAGDGDAKSMRRLNAADAPTSDVATADAATTVQTKAGDRPSSDAAARHRDAEAEIDWKDKALRLQAEMQNYRQRQQRWAEEQVVEEKAALLTEFLEVADNLEQTLKHLNARDPAHQGVRVAYDALLKMLIHEGVERIFAQGRPFDPNVHEAVAVVPAAPGQREEMRVVEVTQPGYRYNNRVLRPAKVIVAK